MVTYAPLTTNPTIGTPILPGNLPQRMATPNPAGPGAGVENAAVNQTQPGMSNQQQMQNFLQALHSSNPAGANSNSFMNNPNASNPAAPAPLVNPSAYGTNPYPTQVQQPNGSFATQGPWGAQQQQAAAAQQALAASPLPGQAISAVGQLAGGGILGPGSLFGSPNPTAQQAFSPVPQTGANNFNFTPPTALPTVPSTPASPTNGLTIDPTTGGYTFNGWAIPSDENLKQDIHSNKPSLDNFMKTVGTWQYQYKEPEKDGKGTFYGPMAQELEKTEVGKSAVLNTPRGKMVDTGRLSLINTSALSLLNKQQDRMQQQINLLKKQLRLKNG